MNKINQNCQPPNKIRQLTLSTSPALPKFRKMVFRVFLASIFVLGQTHSMAQIEKLTTKDDVLQFVHRVAPSYGSLSFQNRFRLIAHSRFDTKAFDSLEKVYHLQSFEKVDLDGNGLTDLIFNGAYYSHSSPSDSSANPLSLAILSFGHDSFSVRNLSLEIFEDIAAHGISLDGKSYIQTIRATQNHLVNEYHIDTLAWLFNTFIEKKPPAKRKIIRIDYNGSNSLAFWTDLTLRIAGDSSRLIKERFEGGSGLNRGGIYLTQLDSNTSQRLYGLLEAIDFAGLKDSFSIDVRDADLGILKITYDDGQVKWITDYGTCGTYGLAEIHRLLYGLQETQYWTSADPVVPRCIDSLHSDREVLGLLSTLDDDYPFLDFEPDTTDDAPPDYWQRLATFGSPRWQKADIDGNGYTDLLFNGYLNKNGLSRQISIVVLSIGDSLRPLAISGTHDFFAARLIKNDGHDNVQINYLDAIRDSAQKKGYRFTGRKDTLTAYDGQIVELPSPTLHHIKNIRLTFGDDSIVLTPNTIRWYKNDAPFPMPIGDSMPPRKDSINLYILKDAKACQKLFSFAAGIRFERLDPHLLPPNKGLWDFSLRWYIDYDGGKQSQPLSDGLCSFRLQALYDRLWDLKFHRADWKFVSPIHIQ